MGWSSRSPRGNFKALIGLVLGPLSLSLSFPISRVGLQYSSVHRGGCR